MTLVSLIIINIFIYIYTSSSILGIKLRMILHHMTKLHQRHQTLLLSLHHYHDLGQPHNHQHTHTYICVLCVCVCVCVCVLYFVHQTISLVIFFTHTLPCSIYQHLFAVTGSGEDFMSNITITLTFASFSSGQPTFGCGSLLLPTVAQLLYFSAQYVSVG